MAEFKELVGKVAGGATLTVAESTAAFTAMTSGDATPAQVGAVLMAMRLRGETVDEITGAVAALRTRMVRVTAPPDTVDVVGTGGDSSGSYNVSTCAALIVAGAGVTVAKHGNRARSSRCGAADVLAELGVRVDLGAEGVSRCVAEVGIGFMFAPVHHPVLRRVDPVRVELGTRTVFNLLGPLLNPAGVRRHMIGVFSREWVVPVAEVLGALGSERALVVHGSDGLDEITTTGPTTVASLEGGEVRVHEIAPEDVGLPRSAPGDLVGGDAATNAAALLAVLRGEPGAFRDIAVFNAAAGLVAAGRAADLADGVHLAAKAVDSGQALDRLERLVAVSNEG
ncbi:anthranilate phosphoribosyltransferase [Actinosynnema sp. NPDC059335]|uniref:anthranilate phosphoribosyltransferase n=1 Tax=Actinosynnema sp. NPDC059335 TaxID=3346804 RepID=UPI00366DB00C